MSLGLTYGKVVVKVTETPKKAHGATGVATRIAIGILKGYYRDRILIDDR